MFKYLLDDENYAFARRLTKKCTKCETEIYISCKNGCDIKYTELADIHLDYQKPLKTNNQPNLLDENFRSDVHALASQADVDKMLELLQNGADATLKTRAGQPPIYFAMCSGCPHMIKLLIDWGNNVNEKIPCWEFHNPVPLLHHAVYLNDPIILQELLHCGADIELCDSSNYTALHLASERGSTEIVQLLLDHGARTSKVTEKGNSPLMIAVEYNFNDVFDVLMNNGANINQCNPETGETVLHIAATKHDICILQMIFKYEVDLDALNKEGCTPLHVVINNNKCQSNQDAGRIKDDFENCQNFQKINTVVELLKHGANINLKNRTGQSVLHVAIQNDFCKHLVQVLLDNGADINLINYRAYSSLSCAAEEVVRDKKNQQCRNSKDRKLLHKNDIKFCPNKKKIDIFIMLLNHGAKNVNLKIKNLACRLSEGCKHLVKILIDNGADINARENCHYYTALHLSVKHDSHNRECISNLLKFGADINTKDYGGYTPLLTAIMARASKDVIQILLERGADVNVMTPYGGNLLHYLAECGRKLCNSNLELQSVNMMVKSCPYQNELFAATELLKRGAKINAKDVDGKTPLHIAIERSDCKHLIQIFLDAGADVNIPNNNGQTPLETIHFKVSLCSEKIELLMIYGADYECILNIVNIFAKEGVIQEITRFRVARQMAGLPKDMYHHVNIPRVDENKLQRFKEKCTTELDKLKSEKLIENLTAWQFLLFNKRQLAYLVSRHKAKALLEAISRIESQSPIYGSMLRKNWAIGKRFAPVFKKAVSLMGSITNPRLLSELLQIIISYLDYDATKMLIRTINEVECSRKKS